MLKCIPARVVLAILCATGIIELYISRINLSIAIVEMVQIVNENDDVTEVPQGPYCLRYQNESSSSLENVTTVLEQDENYNNASIKLTTTQRGYILSSFFYTYGLTAILGGRLAENYGTKKLFGAAVFVDALGNFLIPTASKSNYMYIMIIRSIMGFFQGTCFPGLHAMLSHWIPKQEFSRFIGFVYNSNNIGSIIALNLSGVIIVNYGWELVFYVSGIYSLVWLVFWVIFMYETPEIHPRIKEKEKIYIMKHRAKVESSQKPKKTPWLDFATSVPLWAVNIAHCGNMFGLIFLLTQLPLYMSSIIGVNIKTNGLLSSLPLFALYIGSVGFSCVTNYLMGKVNWTKTTWQRICTFLSHGCTGLLVLLVGYAGCSPAVVMCLFSIAMFINGIASSGYICNHLQITPNFAG
ncbi:UNVERIFIED_CONTAM: hypothetical protein RMT77_006126 [Armadillidium vulgare]